MMPSDDDDADDAAAADDRGGELMDDGWLPWRQRQLLMSCDELRMTLRQPLLRITIITIDYAFHY